jgi:hypothetical protein
MRIASLKRCLGWIKQQSDLPQSQLCGKEKESVTFGLL